MKYTNILFDLDGTIIDSYEGISKCIKYALSHFGILENNQDKLKQAVGPSLYSSFTTIWNFNDNDAVEAIKKYRQRYASAGIYESKLYSNILKMLEVLRENNAVICIASSKPQNSVEKILEHFNIDQYFTHITGSDPANPHDTKQDVLNRALQKLGTIEIGKTVMIGDRHFDLNAAEQCGIDGIGVLYGFGDFKELSSCQHIFLANTVTDLTDYILN